MTTWQISIEDDWRFSSRRHNFILSLKHHGFVVKLSDSQPDMYRSVGARFCYTVSHEHARAFTLFVLSYDAQGLDMRITEL